MEVVLLLVALCCGPGLGSSLRRPMWYHSEPKDWDSARTVCESDHGGDLLTALSQGELDGMDLSQYDAWIGRWPHGSDHYHWGSRHGKHTFNGLPPGSQDKCAFASHETNSMHYDPCSHRHFFFCSMSDAVLSDTVLSNAVLFVPHTQTWYDAYKFCESRSLKLLTFSSINLRSPGSPVYVPRDFPVWIGLNGKSGSWSWGDGQKSDFRSWASGLGSDPGSGTSSCVSVGSQSKSMSVHSCSQHFLPFLCYKPSPVLLQELLTWEQAVERCKNISSTISTSSTPSTSFRLLSVDQTNMETIKKVLHFAQTDKVWVGLRFLAGFWFWSDGVLLPLPSVPSCPGPTLGCGALVVSAPIGSEPVIEASDCSEKLNLLCYDPDHWP